MTYTLDHITHTNTHSQLLLVRLVRLHRGVLRHLLLHLRHRVGVHLQPVRLHVRMRVRVGPAAQRLHHRRHVHRLAELRRRVGRDRPGPGHRHAPQARSYRARHRHSRSCMRM